MSASAKKELTFSIILTLSRPFDLLILRSYGCEISRHD